MRNCAVQPVLRHGLSLAELDADCSGPDLCQSSDVCFASALQIRHFQVMKLLVVTSVAEHRHGHTPKVPDPHNQAA
jgi:hypothetical protein